MTHVQTNLMCRGDVQPMRCQLCGKLKKKKKKERNENPPVHIRHGPTNTVPRLSVHPPQQSILRVFPMSSQLENVFFLSKERKRNKENFCMLLCRQGLPPWMPLCVIFPNVLCEHSCNSSLTGTSALHVHPQNPQLPIPAGPGATQRAGVDWNEWVSQCELAWAKWKCQARHRSPLSACSGSCLAGEHKQNDAKSVTVNTSSASILSHSSLFSWER